MESVKSQNSENKGEQLSVINAAGSYIQRVKNWLNHREMSLQPNEQLRLTAILPGGREIFVECIGNLNSDFLIVDGIDLQSGRPCNLISHLESLQLLWMTEPVKSNQLRCNVRFR